MPEMMKAQVFYEPEKMALEERPVPEIDRQQFVAQVSGHPDDLTYRGVAKVAFSRPQVIIGRSRNAGQPG